MEIPEGKGAGFISFLAALREEAGIERFERAVAALPEETRALVHAPPLAISWMPYRHFNVVRDTFLEVALDGNLERLFSTGRRQFERDLSGVYKMFIRIASPQFVIERASQLWSTYTRHHGDLKVTRKEKSLVEVSIRLVENPGPGYWINVRGSIHACLDLTGAKDLRVELTEGGGTGSSGVYRATWR